MASWHGSRELLFPILQQLIELAKPKGCMTLDGIGSHDSDDLAKLSMTVSLVATKALAQVAKALQWLQCILN